MTKNYNLQAHNILLSLCAVLCFSIAQTAVARTPVILTTIKPVHSLVSNLTKDITQPGLLLDSRQSPHDFQLKPSDRRKIAQADIIIYVSGNIETYIAEISNSFASHQQVIELIKAPAITLLPIRAADHHHHHDHDADYDGHIWLSIKNALAMTEYLYQKLSQYDPEHQPVYLRNKQQLIEQLSTAQTNINQLLSPVRHKPYLTFHDAFQYFETEFNLTGSHFVTSSPEHISSIKTVKHYKRLLQTKNIRCIYYEPPVMPKILNTLQTNSNASLLPLDPTGSDLQAGHSLYFELLNNLVNQLYNCLK
ncbi:MAG: zinc ABC transporter substrate-binding protein [Gammaproteobacteria bacterium]|nr:zinc ABC transporter substrate-binding protein [Gammaproteobacteria bacterium]